MATRPSVPAGIFSSVGNDKYDYCFRGSEMIRLGDHPARRVDEMEEELRLPAVRDTDPESAPTLCHVTRVFRNAPARIWYVFVAAKGIGTTANHPFYVQGKGWVRASNLVPGDMLRTLDGGWIAVEGVEDSGITEPVFNLQVESAHTYFVEVNESVAILVHNSSVGSFIARRLDQVAWAVNHPVTAYGAVTSSVMDAWKGNVDSGVRQLKGINSLSQEDSIRVRQ